MRNIISLLLFFSSISFAGQSLLLVGGGERPPEALAKFTSTCGEASCHVLVITWATDYPEEAFNNFCKDILQVSPLLTCTEAPRRPSDEAAGKNFDAEEFLKQLRESNAVFLTGGDQNKIMEVLQNKELLQAISTAYAKGLPFGGTSAGTAVMSKAMFNGHEADLSPGLGLLPQVLLDTHFIVRQRLPRLEKALQSIPDSSDTRTAIGIDEDNAIFVTDNAEAQVFGPTEVQVLRKSGDALSFESYKAGNHILIPQQVQPKFN